MTLPTPHELHTLLPLSQEDVLFIQMQRDVIEKLVQGQDSRFAIVLGPCSLHDMDSAIEYAKRLHALQKQVDRTCLLVMRAHIEKPRTGLGWKGLLYDPFLSGEEDLVHGLFMSRQILLCLAQIGIPLASEFLDPLASCYFSDLISWGFIGARTSTSQIHRQLASYLPMPIGFKNSTDGNIANVIQGALTAKHRHSFLHINENGRIDIAKSRGHTSSHIVLRGSDTDTNYDPDSIRLAITKSMEAKLDTRILIDCSHGNSQKSIVNQQKALASITSQYIEGNTHILGAMLESHLQEGNQAFHFSPRSPSVSITDPCLGWSETEELVLGVDEKLSSSICSCS